MAHLAANCNGSKNINIYNKRFTLAALIPTNRGMLSVKYRCNVNKLT